MRPLSLTLRGLSTLVAPLTLDLSPIEPGLVALVGKTGGGKTSLMDALAGPIALFREFSTRPEPVQRYCTGRDAVVDLTFSHQGLTYRSLQNFDSEAAGGAGKSEAFLFGPGASETKGRTTDFDQLVRGKPAKPNEPGTLGLFPSREVFYAAAFSAQDKGGNFFALTPPLRKALFAELIGLGALQARSERAGAARKILDGRMADLDREVAAALLAWEESQRLVAQVGTATAALVPIVAAEREAEAALHAAVDAGSAAVGLLQTLEEARATATKRIAELDAEIARATTDATATRARIADLDRLIADEEAIRSNAAALVSANARKASAETDFRAARAIVRAAEQERSNAVGARDRAAADRDRAAAAIDAGAIARDRAEEMEIAIAPLAKLRADHAVIERSISDEEAAIRPLRSNAANESGAADLRLARARAALETARGKAGLLEGVPCRGGAVALISADPAYDETRADCGTCRFLADARAAALTVDGLAASLPDLEAAAAEALQALADVQERDAALTDARVKRDRLARERDALAPLEARLAGLRAQVDAVAAAEVAHDEAAGRHAAATAEIAGASTKVHDAQAAEAEVVTRGAAAAGELVTYAGAAERLTSLEAAQSTRPLLVERLADLDRRATEARTARVAVKVPDEPAAQRLAAEEANGRTNAARAGLTRARVATQEARSSLDVLRGKLAQLGDTATKRAAVEERRQKVAARRAGFVLVERAFGRDGVQALELDAAGPEVSVLANELLATCFGARFTVRLRTIQEAGAGKTQREVCDVEVFDGVRGGVGAFGGLSGGEQVLVGTAFRLALTVFNARRHGGQFECLWLDEADTGLDEGLRAVYPTMLRCARELGGFRNVYFISHSESAWSQADHVLRVEGGAAWIER